MADRLFAAGVTSPAVLATCDVEELMGLARVDEDKAQALQQNAEAVAGGMAADKAKSDAEPAALEPEETTSPDQPLTGADGEES